MRRRHEVTDAKWARLGPLLPPRRAGAGRPQRGVGDKGYTGRRHRAYCRRGIRCTIPKLRTERRTGPSDRAISRLRNRVERLINRCKQV